MKVFVALVVLVGVASAWPQWDLMQSDGGKFKLKSLVFSGYLSNISLTLERT